MQSETRAARVDEFRTDLGPAEVRGPFCVPSQRVEGATMTITDRVTAA